MATLSVRYLCALKFFPALFALLLGAGSAIASDDVQFDNSIDWVTTDTLPIVEDEITRSQPTPMESSLTVQGDQFFLNGSRFRMFGIRVAGALKNDTQTQHLIDQLDDYKAHGVNSITVFYQGCRVAAFNPFSNDGLKVDPAFQARMERIIKAAEARNMVVIAGIFYQNAPFTFNNAAAVLNAVRTVTRALAPYRSIIINVANENNNPGWADSASIYDFKNPQKIIDLCRVVHSVDPQRLVGGGGYDPNSNITIGRSTDVDVLLFDTPARSDKARARYDQYFNAGVKNKPIVDVETFGLGTTTSVPGVFPTDLKNDLLGEVDAAVARPGLSVFLHAQSWCQGTEAMRYDLAGDGTSSSPGIRWYFEYVKRVTDTPTPTPTPTPTVTPTPTPTPSPTPKPTPTPSPAPGRYNDTFTGKLSQAWTYKDYGGYTIKAGQTLVGTIKNPSGGRIAVEIWQPNGRGKRICTNTTPSKGKDSVCKVSTPGIYTVRALDVGVHSTYTLRVQSF